MAAIIEFRELGHIFEEEEAKKAAAKEAKQRALLSDIRGMIRDRKYKYDEDHSHIELAVESSGFGYWHIGQFEAENGVYDVNFKDYHTVIVTPHEESEEE